MNDEITKSSKEVTIGDTFSVKTNPIWRVFKVLAIPKSRIGAKLVEQHILEVTSSQDLDLLRITQEVNRQNSSLGIKGRPTKKDRRDLDDLMNG